MSEQQQVIQREVAHRLFASELNASGVEIKGDDERAPSYVLSPLGAKVNRLFLVGVLTESEDIGQDGRTMYRARVSDPTGLFTVYAGEYQPEATEALANLEAPCFVAVVGKARTYEPEPGQLYVSVRPETIVQVDEATRDQWILETAEHSFTRVRAMEALLAGQDPIELPGVLSHVAEGVQLAREHYGQVDTTTFRRALQDTLGYLEPGAEIPVHSAPPTVGEAAAQASAPKPDDLAPPGDEALEQLIVQTVQNLLDAHTDGAPWDEVIDAGTSAGHDEDAVEESLNVLIDRGVVYEPILGKLKLA